MKNNMKKWLNNFFLNLFYPFKPGVLIFDKKQIHFINDELQERHRNFYPENMLTLPNIKVIIFDYEN